MPIHQQGIFLIIIIANALIDIAVTAILIFLTSIILDITANYEYCCVVNIETVRTVKENLSVYNIFTRSASADMVELSI